MAAPPPSSFHIEKFAKKIDSGKAGISVTTRVNYFSLKPPSAETIYVYSIIFGPSANGRDIKKRELKKQLIQRLLQQDAFRKHSDALASDYGSTLVSLEDIQLPSRATVDLPAGNGAPTQSIRISLSKTHDLHKQDFKNFVTGAAPLVNPYWFVALNIMARKDAAQKAIKVGADRFFPPETGTDLRHGLNARRGYFSSIRPVLGNLVMIVHGVSSAFVNAQALHLYPEAFYPTFRASLGSAEIRAYDSRFKAITKGLYVKLLYIPQTETNTGVSAILGGPVMGSRTRRISGFGASAAIERFNHTTHGNITILDYFNKHVLSSRTPLKYPHLLVCNVGTRDKPVLVPSELLHIVPHQPFLGQLPDTAMSQMIKVAQKLPGQNVELIEDAFKDDRMFDQKALLRNGLTISTGKMMLPKGRFLRIPDLIYHLKTKESGCIDRGRLRAGRWDLKNKKFNSGGEIVALGVIEISDNRADLDTYKSLAAMMTTLGMSGKPVVFTSQSPDCGLDNLKKAFGTLSTKLSNISGPKFVLILLPGTKTDTYAAVKWWADTQAGVHTVCVTPEKVKNIGKKDFQANLALKINVKAGGRNHILDDTQLKLLQHGGSTMVVGADVTHPDPGSIAHCPSIAAVVASTDRFAVNFPGSMRLQRSKQEGIAELKEMVQERLEVWHPQNGQTLPTNILFYRDGVSESQFAMVRDNELAQIQQACVKTGAKFGISKYSPNITLVVCGKRHHTRFYPTDKAKKANDWAVDGNGNWAAGLVVDDPSIRNPNHFDFYLQSHVALKGTARPCHYFVIHNGMKLTSDEIQQITFNLCWTFSRALTPISYASPAYYADLLCERGRCYLAPFITAGHPFRQRIEDNMARHMKFTRHMTMEQKDEIVLRELKNGYGPLDQPHWPTGRSNPQMDVLAPTMFYT